MLIDSWTNDSQITIPNRSSVYSLEPIGIGTPYVESLTGYISRLAQEHCVTTGTFISEMLEPHLGKLYLSSQKKKGSRFYDFSKTINTMGKTAIDIIIALQTVTQRDDLPSLTISYLFKDIY